ncbi:MULTISPECIES: hypothetical protein [unclassified Streptomyces]|uniref:hypothetical protein n=1 Tax=unclassified Streptomyces TaxID=2593676 RepID=UPI000DBA3667|nr:MULTISPECIES: hypothetical protein [unclassified Streptomyces]MYT68265.1 hypothetical protein [Streptomyces sp. SID8367]RAJ76896.1 hypothetical protein K377_06064 [Streptomyces sp. PsTaAH-137]
MTLNVITCAPCDSAATYRVRADGWFDCPAGHELAPADVDFDGMTTWAVDDSGTLGTVVCPSQSLHAIADALTDLDESDYTADPAHAARAALDTAYSACVNSIAAYRCGIA